MAKLTRIAAILLGTTLCASAAMAQSSVNVSPIWQVPTNCSGSIASGGAAQKLVLPSPLHYFTLQNLSTDPLGFSAFTTTPVIGASNTALLLAATGSSLPGGSYTSPPQYAPNNPIYVIAATTGDKFYCEAW